MKRYQGTLYSAEPSDGRPRHYVRTTDYAGAQRAAMRHGIPTRPVDLVQIDPDGRRRRLSRHPPEPERAGRMRQLWRRVTGR